MLRNSPATNDRLCSLCSRSTSPPVVMARVHSLQRSTSRLLYCAELLNAEAL